ncbi:MAG: MBL fold metallo-hydrolase, partial [Oscillospiraceae bacterium]|nr:MBL fold metallo-hydrolase [Oscillospiraceae bacterium]
MKIRWYGHSCFLVETAEGSVVLDPYAPGSVPGLRLPPLTADAVSCSHGHSDHGWREGVRLTGRQP